MSQDLPAVVIFRKQVLPYSETFIADQGRFLTGFKPYYAGFQHKSAGESLLKGAPAIILEDYARSLTWSKLKFRLGMNANRAWLKSLKQVEPVLIHAHFTTDAIDAMRLSERLEIPFIATAHGNDITKYNEPARYVSKRKEMFHKASKVIAVSNFIRDQLVQKGCPRELIIQHYIGIDIDKFTGEKAESETPNILFVGRLVEKKGCSFLLEAVAQLKSRFPGLVINIVGTGPLEKELRQQAAELKLQVNFLGSKSPDEVKELMLRSWIFSTPSITAANGNAEGLGMVFLEAQSLRTPVVSFSSGGVVEAVEHGVSGLLCEERDVATLANNLAFFLENKRERINYGDAGRARIIEKFNIMEQCKQLESIYTSAIN